MQYEILLVDDEHSILDTIGPLLEVKGYGVTSVDNGKAAIELVAKRNFDLVITDLVMDEPDGIEVLKNTKELSPETMVIILTGYGDMESAIKAFRLGADDYLVKPCDIQEIYFRVSKCLEKQGLKRQIARQIEERRQAEGALRISDSAIAASINGIAFADIEGNLTYLNDSCLGLWGYENEEEVLGRPATGFWKSGKKASGVWKAFLRDGFWIGELTAVRKDGSLFDAQMSVTMITDKANKPASIMASFVDVTEQNKMREALARSARLSSLGRFVAGLAHEIRNPLGVIGFSSDYCLKNMELESQLQEHLELISRNSERANKRIGDLLAFAKPSDMERKEVDINDVVNRMLDMARLEAHHSDITFVPKFRKRLPKLVGDEEKLSQVFFNLMQNAVQAVSGKGRVTIQTRFMASQDLIEVNVIDDGPGIPEENRSQIFDPFFTKKGSGTGLGLSICHTIVEQHKGTIAFECDDEHGTKFSVRLPLNRD